MTIGNISTSATWSSKNLLTFGCPLEKTVNRSWQDCGRCRHRCCECQRWWMAGCWGHLIGWEGGECYLIGFWVVWPDPPRARSLWRWTDVEVKSFCHRRCNWWPAIIQRITRRWCAKDASEQSFLQNTEFGKSDLLVDICL